MKHSPQDWLWSEKNDASLLGAVRSVPITHATKRALEIMYARYILYPMPFPEGRPMTRARSCALFFAAALALFSAGAAEAHCDTLEGPVVSAARTALASGNVNDVLIWVKPDSEAEIRAAFKQTQAVRKLSPAAQELADHAFFETVVRLHRQGEGAPFDGLKADADLGPAIPAADQSIASGNLEAVKALLSQTALTGLRQKYEQLQAKRIFDKNNLAAGREYVEAYVAYLHYVEGLYDAASGHAPEEHAEAAHH